MPTPGSSSTLASPYVTGTFILSCLSLLSLLQSFYKKKPNPTYLNNALECLDVSADLKAPDAHDQLRSVIQSICPSWSNLPASSIQIQVIHGGITNLLFRATTDDTLQPAPTESESIPHPKVNILNLNIYFKIHAESEHTIQKSESEHTIPNPKVQNANILFKIMNIIFKMLNLKILTC